ncbi:MAG TPA: helix-turn-helix domain-containing protein [Solirubrobacterales bacterium]|nr:helix-turn-helix domain-containing protein [Solirubrobacterales bacterium]
MATKTSPKLIDPKVLKAQSHPIRAHILNILSEGPNSPARMQRRMDGVHLNLVCHHIKVLREAGLIELTDVKMHGGRKEHIYRATQRQFFDLEEWLAIDEKYRQPLVTTILEQISEDTGRSMAEGKFNLRADAHVSRAPVELDEEGWQEVIDALDGALEAVLEAHARSAERTQASGEQKMVARVAILQYPIGREDPREREAEAE